MMFRYTVYSIIIQSELASAGGNKLERRRPRLFILDRRFIFSCCWLLRSSLVSEEIDVDVRTARNRPAAKSNSKILEARFLICTFSSSVVASAKASWTSSWKSSKMDSILLRFVVVMGVAVFSSLVWKSGANFSSVAHAACNAMYDTTGSS